MNSNQIIILSVFLGYLLFNIIVSFVYSKKEEKKLKSSSEEKYFIGGRNMNGIVLAMTIMATYTSVSSFISGPGAAGLTYGYAQVWFAAIQIPVTFLVLGVLGNKLALVSRRTGAVTVVGYFKARYKSDVLEVGIPGKCSKIKCFWTSQRRQASRGKGSKDVRCSLRIWREFGSLERKLERKEREQRATHTRLVLVKQMR